MMGLYKAKRLEDGEEIVGNLVHQNDSLFAWILTAENYGQMRFRSSNEEEIPVKLVRVLRHIVEPYEVKC